MVMKKKASDFRYDTGKAKVPWAAVGENIQTSDAEDMLRFLFPPSEGKKKQYESVLRKLSVILDELGECSGCAGKLSLGNKVAELEKQIAKFLKAKYALFLTNATAGFQIGYKYAGIQQGDEVIIPAITFIATMTYPLEVGAKVVLADVDPLTLNMDPKDVEKKITKKTKAIVPVHLGGYPVDMDPIMKLAKKHNITVIEDAAHAFGAVYKGKMAGTIGHFGAYSFHEVKNINSLGEGGILVSNLPFGKYFPQARFLGLDISRQVPTWLYDIVALKGKRGYFVPSNHSATEAQALVLLNQMKRVKNIISARRKHAEYLTARFSKVSGIIPQKLDTKDIKSTYHLYLFQIDPAKFKGDIQTFKKKIGEKGIVQIPHFAPLYKFSIMKQLGYDTKAIEKTCPVTEEAFAHKFTHLPLYPLTDEQAKYMADTVIEVVEEMRK